MNQFVKDSGRRIVGVGERALLSVVDKATPFCCHFFKLGWKRDKRGSLLEMLEVLNLAFALLDGHQRAGFAEAFRPRVIVQDVETAFLFDRHFCCLC